MNTRKRYHVEADRLSRIEEDLEKLSLCEDQSSSSPQLMTQHHLQLVQDKLLESIPIEAHLMAERGREHMHLNRDDVLLQQIQQHQMLKHFHVHQMGCHEPLSVRHFQHLQENQLSSQQMKLNMQQTNPIKQYSRVEDVCGDAISNSNGSHYQHLMDFRSGHLTNFEAQQALNEQKSPIDNADNCFTLNEGVKFLKEKYDSLGKVKVPKPQGTLVDSNAQNQQNHERCINQYQEHGRGDKTPQQQPFMHSNESQLQHFHNVHMFHVPHQDICIQEVEQQLGDQWKQQHDSFQTKEERQAVPDKPCQSILSQHQTLKLPESKERHLLNEHDLMQVDIFYRSQRSEIFVSRCCANLMMGPKWSFQSTGSLGGSPASGVRQLCRNFRDWACIKSGIPVLVLDTSKNDLSLILAEHGSGFALWRNRMGPLTGYSVIAADFHALRTDPSMQRSLANPPSTLVASIVGLNFVDVETAEEFYKNVVNLSTIASSLCSTAASPNRSRHVSGDRLKDTQKRDRVLSNSSQDLQISGVPANMGALERVKNQKKSKKLSSTSFSKTDISQPCCFTHVTKLGDRFRDGSSRFFLTSSESNMLLRGTATIDKKSALHRLQSELKPKH